LASFEFIPVFIPTKAHVSKEAAKRLAESNIVYEVQFSIDSTVEDIADWLVRTPGFYRRTLESIENCLEAGLRVSTKSVITPYNILTAPCLYRELKSRGVAQVRLATYNRSAYHHTDDLFNHPESVGWLMRELEILKQEFPDDIIGLQNGEPALEPLSKEQREARWKDMAACSAGRSSMMVCVDGKVIPCEQMPETDENFCGDLNIQSLDDVWQSEEMAKRTNALPRDEFEGTPCFDCSDRHACHNVKGFCIRDTAMHYGSIYTPNPHCPKVEYPFIRMM
jgi:radical SAM protein with 4Fe4S-binding SPASM domain